MKILVSGGLGYLGSTLVPYLLKKGYQIKILDKGYFGLDNIPVGVDFIKGDIRKPPTNLMDGIDAVIHLAALSNDPTADFNPKANWDINYNGTVKIAELAKKAGVQRFIYASTSSIYYKTGVISDKVFTEVDEGDCEAGYPKSKREAEKYLLATLKNPIILRKGTVYGKSKRMRYDLVVNTFVKDAFTKGEIKIHAEGKLERPLLSLTEIVDVYEKMLQVNLDKVGGQIYNVPGQNMRIMDLAFKVYKTLLEKRNIHIKLDIWRHSEGVIRSYNVSGKKLEKLFPERKKQTISEAVIDMFDGIIQMYNPEDPIYYNIKNLEELVKYEKRIQDLGGKIL